MWSCHWVSSVTTYHIQCTTFCADRFQVTPENGSSIKALASMKKTIHKSDKTPLISDITLKVSACTRIGYSSVQRFQNSRRRLLVLARTPRFTRSVLSSNTFWMPVYYPSVYVDASAGVTQEEGRNFLLHPVLAIHLPSTGLVSSFPARGASAISFPRRS